MRKIIVLLMLGLSVCAHGESLDEMINRSRQLAKPAKELIIQEQKRMCENYKSVFDGLMKQLDAMPDSPEKTLAYNDFGQQLLDFKKNCGAFIEEGTSVSTSSTSNFTTTQLQQPLSEDAYRVNIFLGFVVLAGFIYLIKKEKDKLDMKGKKSGKPDLDKILATYSKDSE